MILVKYNLSTEPANESNISIMCICVNATWAALD